MLKEKKIGLIALCNGHYYKLDSLNETVQGLFEVSCKVVGDAGISKLTPVIKNISGGELVFNKAFVSVTLLPGPYEVYTQYSRWGGENRSHWADLNERGIILTHDQGRTTEGNTPFVAMRILGRPEGIGLHVLPLGDWRIRVMPIPNSNKEAPVQVDLGISDEMLAFTMQPGEEWTLPEVIVQHFKDFELSTGELHQFLRKYMTIPLRLMPVEFNTWLDTYSDLDVPRMREQLKVAKEVGCELFVVDAGWFGPGVPGWAAVGDWRERTEDAFFGKMSEFADEVRAAGLDFGIWMEPERFSETAPVVQAHPEWFVFVPNGQKCYRIDLENPDAYAYEKNSILGLIEKYGLKYMKTDMNADQGTDDTGTAHYHYARLFYQMVDEIRAAHPEFIIENCASGSLRTDLESIKHFDITYPSDNGNPFTQMDTTIGFLHRFLPGALMRWMVFRQVEGDVPFFGKDKRLPMLAPKVGTWEEYEQVDFESLLISNFVGGYYGMTGDLKSLTSENRELLKKYIALFKEYRAFLRTCDGYCLQDTPQFQVLELTDGDTAIMIMQYLACDRVEERTIYPVGLKPENKYEFNGKVYTGADILENGLDISMKYVNQHWHKRSEMIVLKPLV